MDITQETSHSLTGDLESQIAPRIQEARENLTRLNEGAMAFVRARPVTCVIGAVALGFIVGKIASRY
ncbi:MAG: hypothetical protein Q8P18_18090 [Pseudomonadota bacterium]|nr:hypothetical protein [Pseudomonadota bacterium]